MEALAGHGVIGAPKPSRINLINISLNEYGTSRAYTLARLKCDGRDALAAKIRAGTLLSKRRFRGAIQTPPNMGRISPISAGLSTAL